jgi:transcriptional regulator with XRE-family HTH domain/DNA-binding MarR family transcriptional regulator
VDGDSQEHAFLHSGSTPFSWASERTAGATAVLFLTLRTGRLAELLHQRALRPHQLDGAQLAVLVALTSAGDDGAMAPRSLGALLAQTPSGITRTVKRLERERLVVRQPDADDGRSYRLRITAAGTEAMSTAMNDLLDQFDQQVERMGSIDLLELVDPLRQVATLFEHQPDRTPLTYPKVASEPNTGGPDAEPVGSRIRRLRTEQGISQRDLARQVGVGAPHVSKLERGDEQPSEALLVRIAGALDVDPDDLVLRAGLVPEWMAEALAADPERARRTLRAWAPPPGA